MQINDDLVARSVTARLKQELCQGRWTAMALATLAMLVFWWMAAHFPYVEPDSYQYQAMADGKPGMKPFAFRILAPAAARLFADITGRSTLDGFVIVGLVSGWILFYGVISLMLERGRSIWFAFVLISMPFWLRNFINYFLPDLPHAALCVVYLMLLQRRRWGWASAVLAIMFLARESTLLLAVVAVIVLWRLVGPRVGLMQAVATLVGMAASKFVARHASANQHNINDTLYMIGKIPWNMSKNVFGVNLWTNTIPLFPPKRVWNVPQWMHAGGIHQVGYSSFDSMYLTHTSLWFLSSFGLGCCVAICLLVRVPLRTLLPREEPYLCIAAIYGAATFLMAPMLGAALERLFDYGWPLFLVYLPAVMLPAWRGMRGWAVWLLVVLNLITAWTEPIREMMIFHFGSAVAFGILLACNLTAGWLLLRTKITSLNASEFK